MEIVHSHEPWNKGKLVGQKPTLKLKDIWSRGLLSGVLLQPALSAKSRPPGACFIVDGRTRQKARLDPVCALTTWQRFAGNARSSEPVVLHPLFA